MLLEKCGYLRDHICGFFRSKACVYQVVGFDAFKYFGASKTNRDQSGGHFRVQSADGIKPLDGLSDLFVKTDGLFLLLPIRCQKP